jgi:hypothetical protein
MKKIFCIVLICMLFNGIVHAQSHGNDSLKKTVSFGGYLATGFPLGNYSNSFSNGGVGGFWEMTFLLTPTWTGTLSAGYIPWKDIVINPPYGDSFTLETTAASYLFGLKKYVKSAEKIKYYGKAEIGFLGGKGSGNGYFGLGIGGGAEYKISNYFSFDINARTIHELWIETGGINAFYLTVMAGIKIYVQYGK